MKSVLLHIRDDRGAESRLQAACDLARCCEAHIQCVQVRSAPDLIAADMYGGAAFAPALADELREIDDRLRAQVEDRLSREGVSWDWRQVNGEPVGALLRAAKLSDVIVATLPEAQRRDFKDALPIAADLALGGRTAVLAMPQSAKCFPIPGRALVAWDGSQEAAAAIRAAVPLLRLAQEVHLVTIEEADKQAFPSTDAPEYLSRHGISVQVHGRPRGEEAVETALLDAINALAADWMVMGTFGHSRLRELVFGGVTRRMLREAKVPLVLAH
ncbi:universal stress protein [Sphingobium cloacae]|uniref:Universal stress protein UspA n=1 Tax=Sphingobium cloacae TaxID=120107 RepID=A0A1E1F015_9SPHN|nr:universal stress protein [Sphingobium cloacae]BAV63801.1 universal stress protein UspA [Sphingobium cloacae]